MPTRSGPPQGDPVAGVDAKGLVAPAPVDRQLDVAVAADRDEPVSLRDGGVGAPDTHPDAVCLGPLLKLPLEYRARDVRDDVTEVVDGQRLADGPIVGEFGLGQAQVDDLRGG